VLRWWGGKPTQVTANVERHGQTHSEPSVKQSLAAIRLFDWLVVGQVLATNPAHAVRGPKHIIHKGKRPILSQEEARHLLASFDTSYIVGLRDRDLIATKLYSFARVEAAVVMNVEDYFAQGRRAWLRLREKVGKHHARAHDPESARISAAGQRLPKPILKAMRSLIDLAGCLSTTTVRRL
jgi:integrase/recombinase XerD